MFRRLRRAALVLSVIGLALVLAAPLALARLPGRDRLLTWAAGLDGSIHLQGASLAWWSAPELKGLEVRDAQGEVVLRLPRVAAAKPLWRLAMSTSRPGAIRIEQPEIHVHIAQDRANWQDVLAPWLESNEPPGDRPLPETVVEIVGAKVVIDDADLGSRTLLDRVDATLTVPGDRSKPVEVHAQGQLARDQVHGAWELSAQIAHDKPRALADAGVVRAKLTGLPLAAADSLLGRLAPGAQVEGRLSGECDYRWSPSAPQTGLAGWLEAEALDLAGPWFAAGEALRLPKLAADCRLARTGSRIELSAANLNCDLGQAHAAGSFDFAKPLLEMLSGEASKCEVRLDVARLAAALPRTLQIRDGTQIVSGALEARLSGQQQPGELVWQGDVTTSQIAVRQDGREFALDQPLTIALAARQGPSGLRVDRLACQSRFLHVTASGTLDEMQASTTFDLALLDDELRQIVDLGGLELSGDGWGHLSCQRDADSRLTAGGDLQVRDLQILGGDVPPWSEKQIVARFSMVGQMHEARLARVDSARIEVQSDSGKLLAELAEAVADPARGPWPVRAQLAGTLESWAPRLKLWISGLEGYDFSGNCQVAARGAWSTQAVEITQVDATIAPCKLVGGGYAIDEPNVRLTASGGRIDAQESRIDVAKVALRTSALEVDGSNLSLRTAPSGVAEIVGHLAWRGDLARLQRWIDDPAAPSSVRWAGLWRGEAQAQRQGARTDARIDSVIEEFAAQAASSQWREKQVRISGKLGYDGPRQAIEIPEMTVASSAVNLAAQGGVAELAGARELNLQGRVDYDLEKLQPLIQQHLGQGVKLVGRETREFSLRGPLGAADGDAAAPDAGGNAWARQLQGQAACGWRSGMLYGLPLGPADLHARLGGGLVRLDPLDVAVSGGRLKLQLDLRLDPGPAELTIPAGAQASQIQITPEMCDQGLKYVAPILAGVTRADGKFSVDLDGCRLPLADPKQGDLAGRFTVHDITVAAGPLVQELAVLLQRPSEVKLTQQSVVPFRMYQGRIYHRDLQLVFPEFTIRTYGSVGLDQTLALMAEMPVPPKWLGNNPLGAALTNQTIKLPIGGTLAAPKLDQQALAQASAQFFRDSATNVLKDELGKQLDRFFAPRK